MKHLEGSKTRSARSRLRLGWSCAVSALALGGCGSDPSSLRSPQPDTSVVEATPDEPAGATTRPRVAEVDEPVSRTCAGEESVACPTGAACARKQGVLVEARPCFAHAREACASLACTTGCDVYDSAPKEVHCAPNASSTGHMKVCGGMAGWQCPERMRCHIVDDERVDDATGVCVPDA